MGWPRALVFASLLVAGCSSSNDLGRSSPTSSASTPTPQQQQPPPPVAPTFDAFLIPSWPPLGPNATVEVRLSDDEALSRVTATFQDVVLRPAVGKTDTVSFMGRELGEGKGTLTLVACDQRSACRLREVSDLV